jgi:hypothetical protein
MGKRSDCRSENNLRTLLAQEAARLICDFGISDYRTAKQKAAAKLGLLNYGALPNNRQIEAAVAERNRIFGADRHDDFLTQLRSIAHRVMQDLRLFRPRLVGSVLSGNITEYSAITLHLFSEPTENVGIELAANGIKHRLIAQRLKLQRDMAEQFPGYRFCADNIIVEAIVFPERREKYAPLSPLDGKPMRRAKLQEVERLAHRS